MRKAHKEGYKQPRQIWDKIWGIEKDDPLRIENGKPVYNLSNDWIAMYPALMPTKQGTRVLDLGCGLGNNTLYFCERGYDVLAADFSAVALESIRSTIPQAKTMFLDLTKSFPIDDNSFDIIVADYSLHYFAEQKTQEIMSEIKRVLKKQGILLARVRAIDRASIGMKYVQIANNYYFTGKYNVRFFTAEEARKYFSVIGKTTINEKDVIRYGECIKTIEAVVICED